MDDFYEEELEEVCKVYDADDFFTIFVQLMLAFAALISLWFKRHYERPRRKFRTWFLDVAKQGVGACYAHVCNMVRCHFGWKNIKNAKVVANNKSVFFSFFKHR